MHEIQQCPVILPKDITGLPKRKIAREQAKAGRAELFAFWIMLM